MRKFRIANTDQNEFFEKSHELLKGLLEADRNLQILGDMVSKEIGDTSISSNINLAKKKLNQLFDDVQDVDVHCRGQRPQRD